MSLRQTVRNFFGAEQRSIGQPWHWLTRFTSGGTAAGMDVTPDSALRVSAVYACIRVISETIASLPLQVYEREGDGKKVASDHPLYSILHDSPNYYQTAFEWLETLIAHLNLRGNSYCLMVPGRRGYVGELQPLNPGKMEIVIIDGKPTYRYTDEQGATRDYTSEQIWHIKNLPISASYNGSPPEGLIGLSPIAVSREAVGLALAADDYGARYFSNNAQVGMNLSYPGKLSPEARENMRVSIDAYSKAENKFKSLVTEEGGTLKSMGITNTDSQFLESRQFSVEEIARIFRVPSILIGHPTNTMTYASAEQMFLSFGKFTVQPWCRRLEQSMNRYLIPEKDRARYFVEFKLEGLLRADTATRYAAHATARQWGWMNADEIRGIENMDPLPDGKGKIYLQPMNMVEAGTEYEPVEKVIPKENDDESAD